MTRSLQKIRRLSAAALAVVLMTCSCASAADLSHYLADARYDRLYRLYLMFFNDSDADEDAHGDSADHGSSVSAEAQGGSRTEERDADVRQSRSTHPTEKVIVPESQSQKDTDIGAQVIEHLERLEHEDETDRDNEVDAVSESQVRSLSGDQRIVESEDLDKGTDAKLGSKEDHKNCVQATPAAGSGGAEPTGSYALIPKIYRVMKGDCLWRISRREYGYGSRWQSIYRANESTIRDPDLIYIDQLLNIPTEPSLYER